MKLRASASAERDLVEVRRHIAAERPLAAERVIGRIQKAAARLTDSPEMGRVGTAPGTREWVVRGLPYILIYEVNWSLQEIVLINVFHGARNRGA